MREPIAGMCVTPTVRLERKFGGGGMGSVWRAEHLALKVPVVVKFLSPALLAETDALGRFGREAAAAAAVRSPHVVQMLDHGVHDGLPFIVMELLDGEDLSHLLERVGRLTPARVVAIIAQVSKALTRAHERGIIHRDIKPANLFLCDVGGDETFVKVLDFGIAKRTGEISAESVTGSVMGTLFYMSPEQIRDSKNIDHRTDVWALGVVAYEMLTGNRPFGGDNVAALSLRIVADPLPIPSQTYHALPRELDTWFAKACARDPGERFQSVRELSDALALALETAPGFAATVRVGPSPVARTKPGYLEGTAPAADRNEIPDTAPPDGHRHDVALAPTLVSQPAGQAPSSAIASSTVDGLGVGESFVARPAPTVKRRSIASWSTMALVFAGLAGGGIYVFTRDARLKVDVVPTSASDEPRTNGAGAKVTTSSSVSSAAPPATKPSVTPSASMLGPAEGVVASSSAPLAPSKVPGVGTKVYVPPAKSAPPTKIAPSVGSPKPSSTWKDIQ